MNRWEWSAGIELVPDQAILAGGHLLFRIGTAVYRVQAFWQRGELASAS